MKIRDHVAAIPFFTGLTENQVTALSTIAESRRFNRGASIFLEGDTATGFHAIVAGQVRIYKLSPDGKEQTLHIFGAGEIFGEVAVFSGKHFPANAMALRDTETLFFPRSDIHDLIQQDPDLPMRMLGILSIRLRRFTQLVEALSLKEVPSRLAAHLLFLSDQKGEGGDVELDVSKAQLASLLGTAPETLSRVLTRMSGEQLIEPAGPRSFRIIDRGSMERLASGDERL